MELKGNSTLKNYSFKWTFMFNKVAYTAWKWKFVSNKYDVWRFISCILLAYYDPSKIFLLMILHILWWACLLNANIGLYAPVFHCIRALGDTCAVRNAFYFFYFKLQTLKRIKCVTDAYLHVVCCDLQAKNMYYVWCGTAFCMHCRSVSAKIKVSNIVIIRHKLSPSCSICDFIKHKASF